jgi:nucleoside-diphosphate-sugar epimerase
MHLEQRILVTGGSGVLGSHRCDQLISEGAKLADTSNIGGKIVPMCCVNQSVYGNLP